MLACFWLALAAAGAGGVGVLSWLGPSLPATTGLGPSLPATTGTERAGPAPETAATVAHPSDGDGGADLASSDPAPADPAVSGPLPTPQQSANDQGAPEGAAQGTAMGAARPPAFLARPPNAPVVMRTVALGGTAPAEPQSPPPGEPAAASPSTPAAPAPTPPTPAPPAATPAGAVPVGQGASPVQPAPAQPRPVQIAAPDPALLEPGPDAALGRLPRIGADGRRPMRAYARPFDPADPRPRVALVLTGLGLSATESRQAIEGLPGAVTLAFSPYAANPDPLLDAARARGHELLVSIPMEPAGYPLDDPGPHALLSGATAAMNRMNLLWALGRIPGAVGATGAMEDLRGERFAQSGRPFLTMQDELGARGLLYLDPRPGSRPAPRVTGRDADLVLDEVPGRAMMTIRLNDLEAAARQRGAAVGLAGPPRPVTLEVLAEWAAALESRGLVLTPLSALAAAREQGGERGAR